MRSLRIFSGMSQESNTTSKNRLITFTWLRSFDLAHVHVDYATQFLIAVTTPSDERCCKKSDADENSFVSHLISRGCVEVFSLPVETVRDKTQSFRALIDPYTDEWKKRRSGYCWNVIVPPNCLMIVDWWLAWHKTCWNRMTADEGWGQGQSTVVDGSKGKAVKYAMGAFLSDYRCSRLEWILFRFALSRSLRLWCVSSLFTSLMVWEFPSYSRNSQDCHCTPMDEESWESAVSPLLKGGEWRADVRSLVFHLNKWLWGQRRSILPVDSFVGQGDVCKSSKKHFDEEEHRERERTNLWFVVMLETLEEIRFLRRAIRRDVQQWSSDFDQSIEWPNETNLFTLKVKINLTKKKNERPVLDKVSVGEVVVQSDGNSLLLMLLLFGCSAMGEICVSIFNRQRRWSERKDFSSSSSSSSSGSSVNCLGLIIDDSNREIFTAEFPDRRSKCVPCIEKWPTHEENLFWPRLRTISIQQRTTEFLRRSNLLFTLPDDQSFIKQNLFEELLQFLILLTSDDQWKGWTNQRQSHSISEERTDEAMFWFEKEIVHRQCFTRGRTMSTRCSFSSLNKSFTGRTTRRIERSLQERSNERVFFFFFLLIDENEDRSRFSLHRSTLFFCTSFSGTLLFGSTLPSPIILGALLVFSLFAEETQKRKWIFSGDGRFTSIEIDVFSSLQSVQRGKINRVRQRFVGHRWTTSRHSNHSHQQHLNRSNRTSLQQPTKQKKKKIFQLSFVVHRRDQRSVQFVDPVVPNRSFRGERESERRLTRIYDRQMRGESEQWREFQCGRTNEHCWRRRREKQRGKTFFHRRRRDMDLLFLMINTS